jgi:hypothetical protein
MSRQTSVIIALRAAAAACCFAVLAGCSSSSSSPTTAADASTPAQTYAGSACGMCVATACAQQEQTCNGDPQCATYLSCLGACPLDASGNALASCVSACPLPDEATGQAAQAALATCRAGASCSACGAADAGSDAAPVDAGAIDAVAEAGPVDSGPTACFQADASVCLQCDESNCCDQATACSGSTVCVNFIHCRVACEQSNSGTALEGCWYGCDMQYPGGVAGYAALGTCEAVSCSGTCNDTCDHCAVTSCTTEYTQCFATADCRAYVDCVLSCSGDDAGGCQSACGAAHPASVTPFNDFETCYANSCPSSCTPSTLLRSR